LVSSNLFNFIYKTIVFLAHWNQTSFYKK